MGIVLPCCRLCEPLVIRDKEVQTRQHVGCMLPHWLLE